MILVSAIYRKRNGKENDAGIENVTSMCINDDSICVHQWIKTFHLRAHQWFKNVPFAFIGDSKRSICVHQNVPSPYVNDSKRSICVRINDSKTFHSLNVPFAFIGDSKRSICVHQNVPSPYVNDSKRSISARTDWALGPRWWRMCVDITA